MRVAVVVPCRNEAAHIAGLLDALAGQTRRPDDIVIVDDGSADNTRSVVAEWASAHGDVPVRLIDGPARGPGPAMNAGVRATTADVIMRFDGHAVPAPDYLERCLAVLCPAECEIRPAVVGGVWRVMPGADTAVARAIAAVVSSPLGSGGALYRHADAAGPDRQTVDTVPFGTFPRTLWKDLGGFDESLEANQDFDFNYRARRAGYRVILDPRIQSTYFARPTLGALWRQYFRYGFWKVRMLRKDLRALRWRQLPPAMLLPWLMVSAAVSLTWPSTIGAALVGLYPLGLLAGGLHIGVARGVNPLSATTSIVVVHFAWSSGFWTGMVVPAASVRP